jgi:hypothetical protein
VSAFRAYTRESLQDRLTELAQRTEHARVDEPFHFTFMLIGKNAAGGVFHSFEVSQVSEIEATWKRCQSLQQDCMDDSVVSLRNPSISTCFDL